MKKLPNGISNYEELIEDGYLYVDKTMYIEKMENLSDKKIMFLRPRKFGKTLFTSVLENYYDIRKVEKFEKLFGETYIGKNPTSNKNRYHILRFNFSGIDTETEETTIKGFRETVLTSIEGFIRKYNINFYINPEQTTEGILNSLFEAFRIQKQDEKIYVLIDEYDHFANELLGFHPEHFMDLVSKNGKVRKWYEILKKGTETVVERILITGVAPITLDSLTSGFNISKDITQDTDFNEMMGFTKQELLEILENQQIPKEEQEKILPIMKENYDGYKFSEETEEQIYNSNMCLYFLSDYIRLQKVPNKLIDVNIASDYSKMGKMLELCKGKQKVDIIRKTISGEGIASNITDKFNPAIEFTETDMISMLYYLGYLTKSGNYLGKPLLTVPNKVMKDIYADYFLKILEQETSIQINESMYNEILEEIALEGKIDKITQTMGQYMSNLSNRDFIKFDEKYVKLIFYCISMNLNLYRVKSEMEIQRKYPDILLIPKKDEEKYYGIMVEFKYLKKEEKEKLQPKQEEARRQIQEYSEFEEIKAIPNLRKYTIVAINDELYVEEI